ncbi:hypothetical protein ACH79_40260 [Bradyrhizobium sp. CCBAU 051011]|uniref:hypothetical protein n=1 Tax=Bradyrhizobium sp. CCBAU 051011 TaxID=858422 RepID=UPI001373ADD8|nr:hypothetical protein [Bradyrhizobium sp. CCBAU 051011]QHO77901.1 hypothetical protein ACH79_40260 [Bradyrhizobium sp. CCBAU 051011]
MVSQNFYFDPVNLVAGRRSGKDSIASAVAAYAAATFKPDGKVRAGERPLVMLLGADRAQARAQLAYIRGYFAEIVPFKAMVQRETVDGLCWLTASISWCRRVTTDQLEAGSILAGSTILGAMGKLVDKTKDFQDELIKLQRLGGDSATPPQLAP